MPISARNLPHRSIPRRAAQRRDRAEEGCCAFCIPQQAHIRCTRFDRSAPSGSQASTKFCTESADSGAATTGRCGRDHCGCRRSRRGSSEIVRPIEASRSHLTFGQIHPCTALDHERPRRSCISYCTWLVSFSSALRCQTRFLFSTHPSVCSVTLGSSQPRLRTKLDRPLMCYKSSLSCLSPACSTSVFLIN